LGAAASGTSAGGSAASGKMLVLLVVLVVPDDAGCLVHPVEGPVKMKSTQRTVHLSTHDPGNFVLQEVLLLLMVKTLSTSSSLGAGTTHLSGISFKTYVESLL
jgi:hypothetical protein